MKCSLMLFWMLMISCCTSQQNYSYQQYIKDHALTWKETYLPTLNNPTHMLTIIDILLLSYQVAHVSCRMIIEKLTIQEELLKLHTPSLVDSWHTNMQVLNNDTSHIEQSVSTIKACIIHLGSILERLKQIGPRMIQINPAPTQTMITDLQDGLIVWTKQQDDISEQIDSIQAEFAVALATINDVKNLFEITLQNPTFQNTQLKQAAGCVSKSYKDVELIFNHFTKIRKTSLQKIEHFFHCFFLTYYEILYNMLEPEQIKNHKSLMLGNPTLLPPVELFSSQNILLV